MELWFWAAILAAILSGLGNYIFKIAAKRDYSSEMFSLYGGLMSVLVTVPLAALISGTNNIIWLAVTVAFLAGVIAATAGITKVYALRHIDTTIFFPLYKLISPLLAIIFGLVFFDERFSTLEWIGLGLGLVVPLLLITNSERGRQSNLVAGLTLVLIGAVISALSAAMHKYAIDLWNNVWWLLVAVSAGIFLGSILSMCWKNGIYKFISSAKEGTTLSAFKLSFTRSIIMCAAVWMSLYALGNGGTLAVVHTVISMYILIPIILAIIFYNEHWNWQKATAIALSVVSLGFLG